MAPKKVGIAMAYPHADYDVYVEKIISELREAEISYKYIRTWEKNKIIYFVGVYLLSLYFKIIVRINLGRMQLPRKLNYRTGHTPQTHHQIPQNSLHRARIHSQISEPSNPSPQEKIEPYEKHNNHHRQNQQSKVHQPDNVGRVETCVGWIVFDQKVSWIQKKNETEHSVNYVLVAIAKSTPFGDNTKGQARKNSCQEK